MSNLYQESTGVTAVTADGQPVGLMLDKSTSGATGDSINPSTWINHSFDVFNPSGSGFTASKQIAGSTDVCFSEQTFPVIAGKIYKLTLNIISLNTEYKVALSQGTNTRSSAFAFTDADIDNGVITGYVRATTTGSCSIQVNTVQVGTLEVESIEAALFLGNHASQPVSTQRPTYNANPDRLTLDLVDDSLLVTIPTGGWDGYMTIGTDQGTASYGVSLPAGDYELGGDYFPGNTLNQVLFREGDIDTTSLERLEQKFVDDGAKASYGDVTNFTNYWRDKSITEFPLIDTSSGTDFIAAWLNNNLTSFPLIDTSSGTTFVSAWYGNNLTSFPLIDTSSGTNFSNAWRSNNLTEFPLIDTSSGTNFSYAWIYNSLTSFPLIDTSSGTNFAYAWNVNNLTSFPLIDTSNGTNFSFTWRDNNLTSFPLINTSNGLYFAYAWYGNNLTEFPLIDTSNGIDFSNAWYNNNLTSFPLINTSKGTSFLGAWRGNNLTSFPLIDTSSATSFFAAWMDNSLTSFPLINTSSGTSFSFAWRNNKFTSFPLLDFSSGANFNYAWYINGNLTDFPANMFDNCSATRFDFAFSFTNLSQSSIDGILVSIESNGTSNGTFDQSGGFAPSSVGEAAIDAMRSRGWTITVTGGY